MLKLTLRHADRAEKLAKEIEQLESPFHFSIFNADLMPAQTYFFEKELFPLARVRARQDGAHIGWELLDSALSEDYRLPPLRRASVKVHVDAAGRIPKFSDPIGEITVKAEERTIEISEGTEREKILSLVDSIAAADPDIIFIEEGDSFTTHYLAERAWRNRIPEKLILSRDRVPLRRLGSRGTSYTAYGKVLHTPTSHKLYGRINLDAENYFVFSECGLDGLFEVARLCRMPAPQGKPGVDREVPEQPAVVRRVQGRPADTVEAHEGRDTEECQDAPAGRPGWFHLRAEDGTPRERRGDRLHLPFPLHHDQVQHQRGDRALLLLPRFGHEGPGRGLPHVREAGGRDPPEPRTDSDEEGELQAEEEDGEGPAS